MKVIRDDAVTRADGDTHNVVTRAAEHLLHPDCLGEMAPTLTLNGE